MFPPPGMSGPSRAALPCPQLISTRTSSWWGEERNDVLLEIYSGLQWGKSVIHKVDKTLQFTSRTELCRRVARNLSREELSTTTEIPGEYLKETQRRHLLWG